MNQTNNPARWVQTEDEFKASYEAHLAAQQAIAANYPRPPQDDTPRPPSHWQWGSAQQRSDYADAIHLIRAEGRAYRNQMSTIAREIRYKQEANYGDWLQLEALPICGSMDAVTAATKEYRREERLAKEAQAAAEGAAMAEWMAQQQQRKEQAAAEARAHAMVPQHTQIRLSCPYGRKWVKQQNETITHKADGPEQQRAMAIRRCLPATQLVSQINNQIGESFEYRLAVHDFNPHEHRDDHEAEEILDAFRAHASRLYGKVRRALQREAELMLQFENKVQEQVSPSLLATYTNDKAAKARHAAGFKLACGKTLAEVTQSAEAAAAESAAITAGLIEYLMLDQGCAALGVTITCPPQYHPNSGRLWLEADCPDAREANKLLQRNWANLLRDLHHAGIKPAGFKATEPHSDGCPHLHLTLMLDPWRVKEATAIIGKRLPGRLSNVVNCPTPEDAKAWAFYTLKGRRDVAEAAATQAWRSVNELRTLSFFGVCGFKSIWKQLMKWAHNERKATGAPPPNRAESRFADINESKGPLMAMMRAVDFGNGRAFFRLFNQHGAEIIKMETFKEVLLTVSEPNGAPQKGVYQSRIIPAGVWGLRLGDPRVDSLGSRAGRPLKMGLAELGKSKQEYLKARQANSNVRFGMQDVTPLVQIYQPHEVVEGRPLRPLFDMTTQPMDDWTVDPLTRRTKVDEPDIPCGWNQAAELMAAEAIDRAKRKAEIDADNHDRAELHAMLAAL